MPCPCRAAGASPARVPPLGRRMMEMAEADEVKAEAADDGDDDHMCARLLEGLASRCDAE